MKLERDIHTPFNFRGLDTQHAHIRSTSVDGAPRAYINQLFPLGERNHAKKKADMYAKIYKNGSLVDTISFAATLSNVTRTQNYIGRSRAGGNAYYEGEMAVVGIFNRDLSASEISELHSFYNGIYNL